MPHMMTPEELRAWRDKHGYSQAELSRALGVIPLSVSRWERGAREIPAMLALALETVARRKHWNERHALKRVSHRMPREPRARRASDAPEGSELIGT